MIQETREDLSMHDLTRKTTFVITGAMAFCLWSPGADAGATADF